MHLSLHAIGDSLFRHKHFCVGSRCWYLRDWKRLVCAAPATLGTLVFQQGAGRKWLQHHQHHHHLHLHPCQPLPVAQPDWGHKKKDRLQILTLCVVTCAASDEFAEIFYWQSKQTTN